MGVEEIIKDEEDKDREREVSWKEVNDKLSELKDEKIMKKLRFAQLLRRVVSNDQAKNDLRKKDIEEAKKHKENPEVQAAIKIANSYRKLQLKREGEKLLQLKRENSSLRRGI